MVKSANCPKGFIELHIANTSCTPTMVRIDMISQFTKVTDEDKTKYGKMCHFCPLGHNNGGFYVIETYERIIDLINKAIE